MSEKIIALSKEDEQWQLSLHNGDLGCYARLQHPHSNEAVVSRIARSAFHFFDSDILTRYNEAKTADASPQRIVKSTRSQKQQEPFVLGITGRSGSGKSTLAQQVKGLFEDDGLAVTTLQTDDYNRGKKAIRRLLGLKEADSINWDAHVVYDMERLELDIQRLRVRQPSRPVYSFDFATAEPQKLDAILEPSDIVIVEGIMANSPVLTELIDQHYTVSTPIATCIGRRVLRDTMDSSRPVSWSAEEILRYMIEIAEPEYLRRFI